MTPPIELNEEDSKMVLLLAERLSEEDLENLTRFAGIKILHGEKPAADESASRLAYLSANAILRAAEKILKAESQTGTQYEGAALVDRIKEEIGGVIAAETVVQKNLGGGPAR